MLLKLYKLLFLCVLMVWGNISIGYGATSERLTFVSVGVDQGLSQSNIQALIQDRFGFVWAGTEDGLNRYDGTSFTVYRHNNSSKSIYGNNITALKELSNGDILLAFKSGHISRYVREKDSFIDINESVFIGHMINDFFIDSSERMWIATDDGIYLSDDSGKLFSRFPTASVVFQIKGDSTYASLDCNISQIVKGRNDSLWIASQRGLLHYDNEKKLLYVYNNLSNGDIARENDFISICPLFDGNVLLGTREKGLFLYDPAKNQFTPYNVSFADKSLTVGNTITAIVQDYNGYIWIGSDDAGLSIVHLFTKEAQKYVSDGSKSSLSNDRIKNIILSKGGRVFVGTHSGGINIYASARISFPHVNKANYGLSSNVIYGFAGTDNPDVFWIATENGLDLWNRAANSFKHYNHDPENPYTINSRNCTGLYRDKSGRLWVFTNRGISYYDATRDRFIRYQVPQINDLAELSSSDVRNVFEDSRGNFWFGTTKGLMLYIPERALYLIYKNNEKISTTIISNNIRQIYEDSTGYIWVATDGGFSRFSYDTGNFMNFKNFDSEKGLPGSVVNAFFEDKDNMWLGFLNGGISSFNKKTAEIKNYSFDYDPREINVYSMLEDTSGLLWMATNKGIVVFDRSIDKMSMHFDIKDGIQSNEFNYRASFKTPSGELFFGGINGFNYFNPRNIKQVPVVAPLVCTGIELNYEPLKNFNKYVTANNVLEIDYRQNHLIVQFSILDYQPEGGHLYMHRLEGHSDDWVVSKNNSVSYERLAPGEYTLYIKGAGADGVWNENPLVLHIKVNAPPWRSWWAIVIYTILIGYAIRRIVTKQQRKRQEVEDRNKLLNEMIEEKTRELQISIQLLDDKNKKLYYLTMHDELTGFFNRKRFADVEEDFGKGLFADKMPFCIIVVDVDGLKLTNDHLGHIYGDILIKEVARIFKESLRDEDIACRIGGDEFALIIPGCTQATLDIIMDRIRSGIDEYNNDQSNLLFINVSLGYSFLGNDDIFKVAFENADEMMYENKKAIKEGITKQIMAKIMQTKEKLGI